MQIKVNIVVSGVANYLPQAMELEHVHLLSYVGLFSSLHACGKIRQAVRRALSFQCSILFLDSCDLVA
jgi:hypothetical protein